MPPPYAPSDPTVFGSTLATDADRLGITERILRVRLLDARLRERSGTLSGWALWQVVTAGGAHLVVSHAGGGLDRFPDDVAFPDLRRHVAEAASVVRYQPGKSCTLREDEPGGPVYRKVLADGRAHAVAERSAVLLAISRRDPRLRIAEPLDVSGDGRSYRTRAASGVPLRAAIDADAFPGLPARVGALVAALHRASLMPDRVIDIDEERREALKKATKITRALPAAGIALAPILADLTAAERPGPDRPCLVHGDLNGGQLLVAPEGVTLLDLDSLAIGDPERDLGELVVDLVLGCRDVTAASRFCSDLLDAYERESGRCPDRARLVVHACAQILGRAWRHHRRGAPGWAAALVHDLAYWRRVAGVVLGS